MMHWAMMNWAVMNWAVMNWTVMNWTVMNCRTSMMNNSTSVTAIAVFCRCIVMTLTATIIA